MAGFGSIYDSNTIRDQLLQNNKDKFGQNYWQNMFNQVTSNAQKNLQELNEQFGQAAGQAYVSAQRNKDAILSSGAVGSGVNRLLDEQTQQFTSAYQNYKNQQEQGEAEIRANQQAGIDSINDALTSQAELTADALNRQVDYINYLYNTMPELFTPGGALDHLILNGKLMTGDQMKKSMKDADGNEIGLYDDEGNLTERGKATFDFIQNKYGLKNSNKEDVLSFDDYIGGIDQDYLQNVLGMTASEAKDYMERNKEIYEWMRSSNTSETGNNYGDYKEMTGQDSDDFEFTDDDMLDMIGTDWIKNIDIDTAWWQDKENDWFVNQKDFNKVQDDLTNAFNDMVSKAKQYDLDVPEELITKWNYMWKAFEDHQAWMNGKITSGAQATELLNRYKEMLKVYDEVKKIFTERNKG